MYLKSLTLKGFKSFADKSVLHLEPGITAIVGPNGSGKSNISDAVLWVLGERNAKNLRGQAMEDVIFAGSSARKGTSMAEVELVLDNSDGTLPMDFTEVVVARRMYRTGESEYLINGAIARRMDVLDILHDTGLGAGTHSIISQGSIDSVLRSKPEDRRALIEEAAGVLKHKQRLARSERKLERMSNHVERVRDVVNEVGRQLGPLERKAKRAKKYEELSALLAEAKLGLAVDDLRELQRMHGRLKDDEARAAEELAARKQAIEAIDAEFEELQQQIRKRSEGTQALTKQQQKAASTLSGLESALALVRDRRRSTMARASETCLSLEQSMQTLNTLEQELSRLKLSLGKAEQEQQDASAQTLALQAKLDKTNASKADLEKTASSAARDIEELTLQLEQARSEQAIANESLTSGMAHLKVLESHIGELELHVKRNSADVDEAEREAQSLEDALGVMEQQEREARNLVAACTRAKDAASEALSEARSQEQSLRAQMDALSALEAQREADAGDAAIAITSRAQEFGVHESLARVIKVDSQLEGLVEMLLGKDVEAVAVGDISDVKRASQTIEDEEAAGEVTLLPLQDDLRAKLGHPAAHIAENDFGGGSGAFFLLDALTYPDAYASVLGAIVGDVVVCETLSDAIAAHETDKHGFRFVTRDGSIVWPSGKVLMGQSVLGDEQGTLARIRHLDELKGDLAQAAEVSSKAADEAKSAESALFNAQRESLKLSEKIAEMRGNTQSARSIAKSAMDKLESSTRELSNMTEQRAKAEAAIAEAKPDSARLAERIGELQEALAQAKDSQHEVASQLVPLQEASARISEELQEAKLALAKATERKAYAEAMAQRHADDLARLATETMHARELLAKKETSASRLEGIASLYVCLAESAQKLVRDLEEAATEAQSSADGMHGLTDELRRRSNEAHSAYDATSERLSTVKIEVARTEMQVKAALSEIEDACGTPIDKALSIPPLENRSEMEESAAQLSKRIANLGTINPDAAQEYDELKERYDYLSGQLSDLASAAHTLGKIDKMIGERMKDDFVTTFEEINVNFQSVFEMLFPGGVAYLTLEDPDDLENTGVEVKAQPAGKRILKMSLMSGGEKSLTALALLFALYRTRPTPFYILDEVEAALDDTNLRRLVGFIDAMRTDAQMILITHQRRTMEMADVLFGVSMQSDGVTKVISQKLEHAGEAS